MGGYHDEYEEEKVDPVRWQRDMDAFIKEFPDIQYSGPLAYKNR